MSDSRLEGNVYVNGNLSAASVTIPPAAIKANHIEGNAGIEATKVVHQIPCHYRQVEGADVVSQSAPVHIAAAAATVVAVKVLTVTAPNGGNKLFTVDVKKSTGGGAYATILTGVITVDDAATDRQVLSGTLSGTPTLVAGDSLQVVIAASGSTGTQGQGVLVEVIVRENPQ
jgi:hypothetical protein